MYAGQRKAAHNPKHNGGQSLSACVRLLCVCVALLHYLWLTACAHVKLLNASCRSPSDLHVYWDEAFIEKHHTISIATTVATAAFGHCGTCHGHRGGDCSGCKPQMWP